MARVNLQRFDSVIETRMRNFFQTLTEKDQRRYAAMEAQRLGHGSMGYVSEILGCSTKTISRGVKELDELANDPAVGRVRRPGAGRKKRSLPIPKSNRT